MDNGQLEALFALPNVTGVGKGLKEVKGIQINQEAVVVLVSKKLPLKELNKDELIPDTIDGIKSDVIEVGEIKAYKAEVEFEQSRTTKLRPAPPGVSIGHYLGGAGTFGALVYDNKRGDPLILSNNHVLANSSNGRDRRAYIGDTIMQPTRIDGRASIFATLYKYVPLKDYPFLNFMDCALAKPLIKSWVVPEIINIGRIEGTIEPQVGMKVIKSGRTTGLTSGVIRATDVTINVGYGNDRTLRFQSQILTTAMSSPGDSGSLVVDHGNKLGVGLLFAGSDSVTVVNPIQPVLEVLGVKF